MTTTSLAEPAGAALRTEVAFTLPLGYVDSAGQVHQDGQMRLATAADEILPMRDPRVIANPAYLTVIVLSRVLSRLGNLDQVTPHVIEGLFAADLGYLQDLYNRVNFTDTPARRVACPHCEQSFELEPEMPGKP
jgi:hypothetical protein